MSFSSDLRFLATTAEAIWLRWPTIAESVLARKNAKDNDRQRTPGHPLNFGCQRCHLVGVVSAIQPDNRIVCRHLLQPSRQTGARQPFAHRGVRDREPSPSQFGNCRVGSAGIVALKFRINRSRPGKFRCPAYLPQRPARRLNGRPPERRTTRRREVGPQPSTTPV